MMIAESHRVIIDEVGVLMFCPRCGWVTKMEHRGMMRVVWGQLDGWLGGVCYTQEEFDVLQGLLGRGWTGRGLVEGRKA